MNKHALILDAGCEFGGCGGSLNHAFADLAGKTLESLGWTVETTRIEDGWDVSEEAGKVLRSDFILVQTPGWWYSTLWQFKKYEDEVFCHPSVMCPDGRVPNDPAAHYGTAGVHVNKHYMLSSTWHAPREAFTAPDQFFAGAGIDAVFLPIHATFRYLGMKPLASFMANDVIVNPQLEEDFERFVGHLRTELAKIP